MRVRGNTVLLALAGLSLAVACGGAPRPGPLLACSNRFCCGVLEEPSTLACWGEVSAIERVLASGERREEDGCREPARVELPTTVEAIAVSPSDLCVVDGRGDVRCARMHVTGDLSALGAGWTTVTSTPSVALCADGLTSRALTRAGLVLSWGSNIGGSLSSPTCAGDGCATVFGPVPVVNARGALLSSVRSLACQPGRACAITEGGALFCWGADVGRARELTTEILGTGREARALGFGFGAARCALDDLGVVHCWRGMEPPSSAQALPGLTVEPRSRRLWVPDERVCAVTNENRVECLDRTTGTRSTLDSPGLVEDVAGNEEYMCVRSPTGVVHCRGETIHCDGVADWQHIVLE